MTSRMEYSAKNVLNQVYCFIVVFISIIVLKRKILNIPIDTMIYVIVGLWCHRATDRPLQLERRCNDKEMEINDNRSH